MRLSFVRLLGLAWVACSVSSFVAPRGVWAAERSEPVATPLHDRIDALLERAALGPLPPPADDAEFLRRAYLDLNGIIPSSTEARDFLADTSPDKRVRLIDQRLSHPRYARHWAKTFDILWLERRAGANIKVPEWQEYLYQSFQENKPYDQLVRELLVANDQDPQLRPAAKFFVDRDCEPNLMTRDIGRLFLGMDLQCAQCHDHPVVDDYRIGDYYGIYAFVQRTFMHRDRKTGTAEVAEKAEGEASFKSVFTGESSDRVAPRVPRGVMLVEPVFAKGQEYLVAPATNVKPVPTFSRRAKFAELISVRNEAFDRNIVNRLWASLMGRGLVHPIEFHHPDNPASHPELMTLLAKEFRQSGYDIKWLLRELALTRAYQRSCIEPRPEQLKPGAAQARLAELALAVEQAAERVVQSETAVEQGKQALAAANKRWETESAELDKLRAAAVAATEVADKLIKALGASPTDAQRAELAQAEDARVAADRALLQKALGCLTPEQLAEFEERLEQARQRRRYAQEAELVAKQRLDEGEAIVEYERLATSDPSAAARAWTALVERWNAGGYLIHLKPLGPEALAMSLMQATGVVEKQESAVMTSLQKAPPEEMKKADAQTRPIVEARLVEKQTYAPLDSNVAVFVRLYDQTPGQDFSATINQSLFFGNGTLVSTWLSAGGGKLLGKLEPLGDASALAEELYLSIFTRLPTSEERAAVADYLKDRQDRAAAIQEMAWALLSSNEFRFNH